MLSIAEENPDQPAVSSLMREADASAASLYPAERKHAVYLDYLSGPDARFWIARREGVIVGMAALVWGFDREGEIRRLFVAQAARRNGVGRALLRAVEDGARFERLRVLRLETPARSGETQAFYGSAGYAACEAFGAYLPDPSSVFLEKKL